MATPREMRDLSERLLEYGGRVISLVESLPKTLVGRRIGDQLLRSGMSAGANYEEARGAESKSDFVHKLQISLKELRESNYWLRLLVKSQKVSADRMAGLQDESDQLRAILSKAVATAKGTAKEITHGELEHGYPVGPIDIKLPHERQTNQKAKCNE